jgi:hypothetical protein
MFGGERNAQGHTPFTHIPYMKGQVILLEPLLLTCHSSDMLSSLSTSNNVLAMISFEMVEGACIIDLSIGGIMVVE